MKRRSKFTQVPGELVPITDWGTVPATAPRLPRRSGMARSRGGRPMRTHAVRTGAALVLTAGFVAGCESSPRRTPYADNPLVQARLPMLPPQAVATANPQSRSEERRAGKDG